jgi:hypothetical protein
MPAELKDAPQRTQAELDSKRLSEEVQMLGEDQSSDFAFADRMLRKIVHENRQANFTESTYFKGKLNWDQAKINREIRRIGNVARLQAIIGTASQREELESERQTASEILESEGPKLEQQIEKLTRQKAQLEKAASNATRRSSEVAEAMGKLRSPELLRTDVLESFNERVRHFGVAVQSKINALQIEIRHRQICLDKPEDMPEGHWLDAIQRLAPECVETVVSGYRNKKLTDAAWNRKKSQVRAELESMRFEVAALELEKATFEESQRKFSGLYIEENN